MSFAEIVNKVNSIAWGPWMLILLVGTGIYLTSRVGFLQLRKFGYAMKNTIGKIFKKQTAGAGEVTPFQAMSTALAATVGTGNIAGVTGAIVVGGPGAVFWMWLSAFFGMVTKYAEVVLAIRYRERNEKGDWVGGPMYYIKNGLGKNWKWLGIIFSVLACLAAFGIGNMTQINTIATSINTAVNSYGVDTSAAVNLFGQEFLVFNLIIGVVIAAIVGMVLLGGIKRIGAVAEKLVPFMAVVYILASLAVVFCNLDAVGPIFVSIFKGAFNPSAVMGGFTGTTIMMAIQKGVGRGVFSNEAGLGSAPMAHAASSETNPVKQGMYGIFEVFVDTVIICTLTALVLLCGIHNGMEVNWGVGGGVELISASISMVFGQKLGSTIVALGIVLFALSTVLSWALYGSRCFEFLFGSKLLPAYQIVFVVVCVIGASMELEVVWNIADTLNGFMAIPNLIALIGLSGVVTKLTKDHFAQEKMLKK
ncbi:MAG: sodium:alanine symporter family protein [Oscillospiraceae bacterium]|nr:sodium:alanine symporter family protein [Oscillospiraceae bacterium]